MAVTIQDDMGRVAMMLPESQRVEFMGALALYGVCGVEPDPEAPWIVIFEAFRERLDMSAEAFRNGRKGGRPKREKGLETGVNNPPSEPPAETHVGKNAKPYENEKENEMENKSEREGERRFKPPTPEEVREYATERGLTLDAEDFCDYYGAQGWRLSNGNRMRDWRMAANRWAKRRSGKADVHQAALDRYSGYVMRQDEGVA